jgi:hypothetical protein
LRTLEKVAADTSLAIRRYVSVESKHSEIDCSTSGLILTALTSWIRRSSPC